MKRKTDQAQSVTKDDVTQLEKRLEKKFMTKKDVIQLEERLGKNVKSEAQALETRMAIKIEQTEMRIDDKARGYRDDVLTKLDGIAKELEDTRIERTIMNHHIESMQAELKQVKKKLLD